jgi:hypothetical protein
MIILHSNIINIVITITIPHNINNNIYFIINTVDNVINFYYN